MVMGGSGSEIVTGCRGLLKQPQGLPREKIKAICFGNPGSLLMINI